MAQQQIIRKAGIPATPTKDSLIFLVKLGIVSQKTSGSKGVLFFNRKRTKAERYFGLQDDSIFSGTGIFRID